MMQHRVTTDAERECERLQGLVDDLCAVVRACQAVEMYSGLLVPDRITVKAALKRTAYQLGSLVSDQAGVAVTHIPNNQ